MLLHINALTLFYYKIVLAVVPYKLEFLLFYDTFNIAVINISLCNRIEKWIFSNCII